MKIIKSIDLTRSGIVLGNHGVYLPGIGLKMPFQFGGRICKRSRPQEPSYLRDSLSHEVQILRALAAQGMAPPIGEIVFIEEVISDFPGAWHCDPLGAYAYEMADANRLPPGRFSLEAMQRLPIVGSPGAWNDIMVGDRANVVNGYLVDVRRSAFDMLRWDGPVEPLPRLEPNLDELRVRVHRECQFPAGERAEAYQDFWLDGKLERGQRRIVERARAMGFDPQPGDTVLDIGCQSGGFLQLAAFSGARAVGVEVDPGYVECARALARSCGQNINIRQMDVVRERDAFLEWVRACFPSGIDHLLLLSMEKHLGDRAMFYLVDALGARRVYIETNAVAPDSGEGPEPEAPMKLHPQVLSRGGRHIGNTRDRNLRRLYQINAGDFR